MEVSVLFHRVSVKVLLILMSPLFSQNRFSKNMKSSDSNSQENRYFFTLQKSLEFVRDEAIVAENGTPTHSELWFYFYTLDILGL